MLQIVTLWPTPILKIGISLAPDLFILVEFWNRFVFELVKKHVSIDKKNLETHKTVETRVKD